MSHNHVDVKALIADFRDLRQMTADQLDPSFWQIFLSRAQALCLADQVLLLAQSHQEWQVWLNEHEQASLPPAITPELIARCEKNGYAVSASNAQQAQAQPLWVLVSLVTTPQKLLAFYIQPSNQHRLSEILLRAQLIADVPSLKPITRGTEQTAQADANVMSMLKLLIEVYQAKHFDAAVYALVNGIVSYANEVEQVVLSWQEGEYSRVKGLSHFDRFEKKTETIKFFEAALEESADQQMAILWPDASSPAAMTLAHRQLKSHLDAQQIYSFPLYDAKGEVVACLGLISYHQPFSPLLLEAITFVTSLLIERLVVLKQKKDFWWLRATRVSRKFLAVALGRDFVWTKVITLVLLSFIIWGTFFQLPHRVSAVSQLVTDSSQLISAPFDGYLDEVYATLGDNVTEGQVLTRLNTQELMLQAAELQAELQRAQAEVDRARASFNLIEQEIAQARMRQVSARLERLQFYLDQAAIPAPFESIVVEGERKDLMGLPVRKGQVLYRLARIEGLYLVMQVAQEDIDYVHLGSRGQFAFISQPSVRYDFTVTQIVPMAKVPGPQGAVFEVKAVFDREPEFWWRPGMTGVGKVDVGHARAFWVMGHKFFNRIRMWLWW
ncbi:efflux RND transporter periplasmic adaptor subunit [Thiomicrospira cyclica]|uniref:Biotin/lipoyl attachment domain-containing protein n=1 Tax=Thiomicrospira cyclica (strain DSM 14477 / JCM 11371 / ALM1) TaxID=717773 RepID=F6DAG1_THICA|nr:efflux RND transporter periplasmic adaptor subunit [Thiomicrospira cyclica]AEG31127.1 biotin/lipoyl attachment domain-containing protein [Thiomicrospira cyclica ALM1]